MGAIQCQKNKVSVKQKVLEDILIVTKVCKFVSQDELKDIGPIEFLLGGMNGHNKTNLN